MDPHHPISAKILTAAILGIGSCTTLTGETAESTEPAMTHELRPYVVVSTRTPLGLDRVSPSVSYVSAEEMEFWQDRSVVDVLARQPGLMLKSNGAPGGVASVFTRGTNSDHTAFFLDGRRLSPAFSGQYDLESLSVENLNSMEILKGASSVNYGSSGIGGVVDLRTRSSFGDDAYHASVEGELGSNDFRRGSVSSILSTETYGLSFSGYGSSTDNERPNDEFETRGLTSRFDLKLFENLSAELVGRFNESEKEIPGSITFPSPNDFMDTENWLLSPGVRYATDELTAHLFYSRSEFVAEGENFGPFFNEILSDEVNLQVDLTLPENLLLTFGSVYRKDDIYRRGVYGNALEQAGAYGQAIWQLTDALEVRGGIRYDDFSDYDDSTTGNLEALYRLSAVDLAFFAKISKAYAPPLAQDLAFDSDPESTPLNPEESVSYELGWKQTLLEGDLGWSVLFFRNEIDELITFNSNTSDASNVEEATTEGVEFSLDYSPTETIDFGLAYTYLTAENDSEDVRLTYRPRHLLQLTAGYRPIETLRVGGSLVGQFDREGGFSSSTFDIEDYVVVGLVADWDLSESWTVFARAENLLDESYAQTYGYPALGRTGYIGARFEF
ncbi:MAG: TonB-dependent receptor plug domain-containing protein [Opitutales bacterium]